MMMQTYSMEDRYLIKRIAAKRTDRKDDLKRICNSIAKINASLPLYKIDLSKKNQLYVVALKEKALALRDDLGRMSAADRESFQSKEISVNSPGILSAVLLSQDLGSFPDTLTLSVETLAYPQINRGKIMFHPSHELERGIYPFRAIIMGQTYPLSYTVKERTNNGQAVRNMVEFLNASLPEITAVAEIIDSEHSCIVMIPKLTGRYGEKTFSFEEEDTYRGGVVRFFGLNQVDKAATPAKFVIDGMQKQAVTNVFALEEAIHITLHKSSETPVIIKLIPDSTRILAVLDKVLGTLNGLIALAVERDQRTGRRDYGAARLINELVLLQTEHVEELEACGLETMENGMLRYRLPQATEAVMNGSMEHFFTRKDGFIGKLLERAELIAINPLEYLEKTVITYPKQEGEANINPYTASAYSGMMFNSYY